MKKFLDKDKLQELVTKLTNKYKTMFSSPLKASTVAEMTDQNKVYVYTGSESGYTAGNWYIYNGSEWISGGVYNAIAFETDKTLAIADKAADAKATGHELDLLIDRNSIDVVALAKNKPNKTQGKVTFTWTGDNTCHVESDGNSSAFAVDQFAGSTSSFPDGVKPGSKLYISLNFGTVVTNFYLEIRVYKGTETDTYTYRTNGEFELEIPDNAIACMCRLAVGTGTNLNTDVTVKIYNGLSNIELQNLKTNTEQISEYTDYIKEIDENGSYIIPVSEWHRGTILATTGAGTTSSVLYRAYTDIMQKYSDAVMVYPANGYEVCIDFYSETGGYVSNSRQSYTDREVYIGANQNFKITVRKKIEDTSSLADLEEFSNAVNVVRGHYTQAIHGISEYHDKPKDYLAIKLWMDAIMEPQELSGSGLPSSNSNFQPDGMQQGNYMIGTDYSAAFNRDADIYFNSSLASWRSMLKNPAAKVYKETWMWSLTNDNRNAYFGGVCSTFVSFMLCQDIFYKATEYFATADPNNNEEWAKARILKPDWLENDLFVWKEIESLNDLETGDIYVYDGHIEIVADVGCDKNGFYTVLFDQYKPASRVRKFDNDSFMSQMATDSAKVGRFKNHHRIRDPREIDLEYCETCIPDKGDKSVYLTSETVNLYVPSTESVIIQAKQIDGESESWNTITPIDFETVGTGINYTLPAFATAGTYAITVDNGSSYAQICVVTPGTVSIASDGAFTCSGYSTNCVPLWEMTMLLYYPLNDSRAINPHKQPNSMEYEYEYNGEYYKATPYLGTKAMIDGSSGNVEVPTEESRAINNGWYIRVMYKTPFGQVHCDSNLILP